MKGKASFSITTFPDGKHFQLFVIFLVAGITSIVIVPSILPGSNSEGEIAKLIAETTNYELTNEVQAGQFRYSSRKEDTFTDTDATFFGASILTHQKAKGIASLKNKEKTIALLQTLENQEFHKDAKEIYEGILLEKSLGIYNANKADKFYNFLVDLHESNSGFRPDSLHSASLSATFYAFKAIQELGKFEDFKKGEIYNSSINFVKSLKDSALFGFSDVVGQNATLSATYFAAQIADSEDLEGVEQFVYACQAQDGGFSNELVATISKYYHTASNVVSTIQGIYILEKVNSRGSVLSNAITFLSFSLDSLKLKENYYLLELLTSFPSLQLESRTTKAIGNAGVGIGALLIIISIFFFYKPQIPEEGLNANPKAQTVVLKVAILLTAGVFTQFFAAEYSIIAYLGFSFYVAACYYEAQSADTTDGVMILISSVNSIVFMTLVASFIYISPFVYGQLLTYSVLTAWSILSSFLTTYAACFLAQKQVVKLSFMVRAGFLSWVTNTLLLLVFLHGRGEMDLFYRLIAIKGLQPIVFVIFPVSSLCVTYFFSAIGFLVYASK